VSIRNDRGEETARKLIGVSAMSANEERTFTLSVEVVSARQAHRPQRHAPERGRDRAHGRSATPRRASAPRSR
jgi:hypothetical protein